MAEKLVGQNYETQISARKSPDARDTPKISEPGACCSRALLLKRRTHTRKSAASTRARRWRARRQGDPAVPSSARSEGSVSTTWETLRANPYSERALASEPLESGEPVLAVCAIDEATAAEAIEESRFGGRAAVQRRSCRDAQAGRSHGSGRGNVWVRPTPTPGSLRRFRNQRSQVGPTSSSAEFNEGRLPTGESTDPVWFVRARRRGFKKRRWCSTKRS